MACPLATERVWVDKCRYHDAEKNYFEHISKLLKGSLSKIENKKEEQIIDDNMNLQLPVLSTNSEIATPSNIKLTKNKKNKINESLNDETSVTEISNAKAIKHCDDVIDNKKKLNAGEEGKNKKKKRKISSGVTEQVISQKKKDDQSQLLQVDKEKEKKFKSNTKNKGSGSNQCTLVSEIAKARQHIKNSLERMDGIAALAASPGSSDVLERLAAVERENANLRDMVESLKKCCSDSAERVKFLEQRFASLNIQSVSAGPAPKVVPPKQADDDDDDGVDLFGSDSEGEDAEAAKIREARLAAYAAKKSKKPALIAKSSLVLDVKPWDDDTDLKLMESEIRKIQCDGLLWGASKFMPVAFGIEKLSISCVVEDEKVSIDWLTEEIEKFEDFVQSVDVAAFNKI